MISRNILFFHTVFCTMWKFQDFSITQILREINFGDSGSVKSAILTHVEALNFDSHEFLHFLKTEIYQIKEIQSPKNCKTSSFRTFAFSKIDFTQNLSDSKIMKFPHCVCTILECWNLECSTSHQKKFQHRNVWYEFSHVPSLSFYFIFFFHDF